MSSQMTSSAMIASVSRFQTNASHYCSQIWNTPGKLPHYKSTGFKSRRFSCCFCRLLSHMISPDMLEGGEVGLSFSLSRYQTGIELMAAPSGAEIGSSLPPAASSKSVRISADSFLLSTSAMRQLKTYWQTARQAMIRRLLPPNSLSALCQSS